MPAKKKATRNSGREGKAQPPSGGGAWRWYVLLILALVVLAALAYAGAGWAWARISRGTDFALSPAALSFGRCPAWVREEPMERELRVNITAALEGAFIFDEDLCLRVRQTIIACPWVREVKSIRRLVPNRLHVELVFRRPAGLVEVDGRQYMVDEDGLWLPARLYTRPAEWEGAMMPAIVSRDIHEPPVEGKSWAGPPVAVGARLTALLLREGILGELQIKRVDVTLVGRGEGEPDVTLETAGGVKIKWGCSDAYEHIVALSRPSYESPDSEKLRMLRSAVNRHPLFRGLQHIDLRHNKIFILPAAPSERGPAGGGS